MIPERYNIRNLRKAINNPRKLTDEISRISHTLRHFREYLYGWNVKRKATPVMEEDWDTLIILDSCRYDAFEQHCDLEGVLERRLSLGRKSREFINENLSGEDGEYNDTIYVTANRHTLLNKNAFFAVIDNDDMWDPELGTIPPDPVIERAKEALIENPNKRLIVHFMQPHRPPIDENGQLIQCSGWSPSTIDTESIEGYNSSTPSFWSLLQNKELNRDDAWHAYVKGLMYILEKVEEFNQEIDGKTIITADHGVMFGEQPFAFLSSDHYGGGAYGPQTMEVPWFSLPYIERRRIL